MRRLILLVAALGCAQQGFPPGGPEDKAPPKLLSIRPDSNAVNVKSDEVELQYDEVLNEQPGAGGSALGQLVLVSPSDGAPKVDWHRSRLTVKGRHGWRSNTTYTITVLPGLTDLRGNAIETPLTFSFSTGPRIDTSRIAGIIFDWPAGHPLASARVEALRRSDSTLFVGRADSSGRFVIPHLSPGTFTVTGYGDANSNAALDPREPWDSARVSVRDSARVELLAFVHDTLPPSIASVDVRDSLTLRVTFDRPLAPNQRLDSAHFRVRAADSSIVPIRRVLSAAAYDKARTDSTSHADSIRARTDTAAARALLEAARARADTSAPKPGPVPSKPIPVTEVYLLLGNPLVTGATYRMTATNVRTILGRAGSPTRTISVPKPPPVASAPAGAKTPTLTAPPAARRDSAARGTRPDTVRARPPR